jgi:hypothetical protein
MACTATRATLLSGFWRVRSTPEVCAWNLKRHERGSFAPQRSRATRAQMRRPARNFAISSKNEIEMSKKNVKRGRNGRVHAARDAVVGVLDRGRERERHRLGWRRAALLHVLADDRHRVPLRHVAVAELDVVGEDPARPGQRDAEEHVVRDVVREVVALVRRPADRAPVDAAPLRRRKQEGEQREGARVVHRTGGAGEVDAFERAVHVVGGVDHRPAGAEQLLVHLVHVVAAEHRVAGDERDGGGALVEDVEQPCVVVGRGAEADQLALAPGAPAMHRRVDAARIRRLPGKAQRLFVLRGVEVARRVKRLDQDAGAVDDRFVRADLVRVLGLPAGLGGVDQLGLERLVHYDLLA